MARDKLTPPYRNHSYQSRRTSSRRPTISPLLSPFATALRVRIKFCSLFQFHPRFNLNKTTKIKAPPHQSSSNQCLFIDIMSTAVNSGHEVEAILEQLLTNNQSNFSNPDFEGLGWLLESDTDLYKNPPSRLLFDSVLAIVYTIICVVGLSGNLLVCWVVFRNRHMQTVTNIFITNLGLADILLCALAGPVTAVEYILEDWVFGQLLCHLLPYSLGVSVYLSVLTLMSIAIDRYLVILHPFRPRMKESTCLLIIMAIWVFSLVLTLPYGMFMAIRPATADIPREICFEDWPDERHRKAFTSATSVLQFIVPFIVTALCYVRVCSRLAVRAKCMPGAKSQQKEELERKRTRRTNRMLITMVVIFGASWLPLNMFHLIMDFNPEYTAWEYANIVFFVTHAIAMSSACYNPFLYAWLNENFRKEFKLVLPCFFSKNISVSTSVRKINGIEAAEPTAVNGNFVDRSSQRPLLASNVQPLTDLAESTANAGRTESTFLATNLVSSCDV
ncbi:neuropeptide Y receptor type 5-like [Tropilaelaps mercedesae]|uniref:Neuropeptide Y receptor type 5-like n=1 Tax=Tropilaelaps mercedesae TaxID=418985 RepID=A0A1V9XEV7_9ACAR|nr:neuropeptide Y receptor type 5-like [Tropilaelaps mercedesae]